MNFSETINILLIVNSKKVNIKLLNLKKCLKKIKNYQK